MGSRFRRRASAALTLAVVLSVLDARAEAPKIALVSDDAAGPIAARVSAELTTLGFEVQSVTATAPPARGPLEATAHDVGAVAAVRVAPSRRGVEVWVVDRVTGKTVLREISLGSSEGDTAAALVASRAVELLRASMLEVNMPHPSRGDVPPPEIVEQLAPPPSEPEAPAAAESPPPRSPPPPSPSPPPTAATPPERDSAPPTKPDPRGGRFASIGPSLLASAGGIDPSVGVFVGYRQRAYESLLVEGFAQVPVSPPAVEAREGSATVGASMLGAGLGLETDDRATLTAGGGAGVALVWLHLEGSAQAPFRSSEDDLFAAGPYLRGALGARLARSMRVRADVLGGVALPQPVVRFAGREVARFGRPFGVVSLSLELISL